jgi:hypothetical protein
VSSIHCWGYVPVLSSSLRPCAVVASAFWTFVVIFGLLAPAQAQDGPPTQAVGMLQVDGVSGAVIQAAEASVRGADRVGKDGPLADVGMELALLYHQNRMVGTKGVRALREASAPSPKADADDERRRTHGRVFSPISADGQSVVVEAVAAGEPSRLLRELRGLGLEGGATAGNVVSGRLPIASIKQAAGLPSLRGMIPSYARTYVGAAESEADSAHRVEETRENFGVEGAGQKVCALSDSYDQNGTAITSASDDVQSGDLPGPGNPEGNTTPVDVVRDADSRGSDEGRALLQLIHDLAPAATLGFHTALGGVPAFASSIRELADVNCTIIVDDIRYNTEPFYQDGLVSNAVDDVVGRGVPYFSSAGNDGQNSYEAPFRDSGEPGVLDETFVAHDFDSTSAVDTRQAITVGAGGTFQIFSFQWTDPSGQVEGSSPPDTDIDISLVDESGTIVASSERNNIAAPVESMEYTNDENSEVTLNLVVEKAPGDPVPDEIKYVYSGNDFTIDEYDVSNATIYGHPMAEGAMAVAAAPFFSTAAFRPDIDSSAFLESFSSKGGIPILFDQNGDRLGSPVVRQKPEVTGTDAVDNTFFGQFSGENGDIPDSALDGIDPDPFPNFAGTSAAAPNIAAIAALIQEAAPNLTPTQVYDRLKNTAVDVQIRRKIENGELVAEPIAAGVDPWSGHGFVRADRAVPAPAGVRIADASASASSNNRRAIELTWQKIGAESVDAFLLERQFFDGTFTGQERITAGGSTEFARTVGDLPVGKHTFRISAIRNDSTLVTTTVSATVRSDGVDVSVFPNPFSGPPNLSVTLPEAQDDEQRVTVRVYDVLGRRVATPVKSRPIEDAESISLSSGQIRSLSSGVYFFRVKGPNFTGTTRAVRVR